MKRITFLLAFISLLSSCKKKCDGCGPNQQCVDGVCQCRQWYEGANCDTPMINKFLGTFIGTMYINSVNPSQDTFVFEAIGMPNATNRSNGNGSLGSKQNSSISLLTSTTGDYFTYIVLPNQLGDIRKKTGKAFISADGQDITLSFYWINGNGDVDSNTLSTFIGTRQ
ncbi:MAG: hypothetical protein JSS76_12780 [Bacteroidetes bacterium]|nr:hypothetical protein [Bacteroidota bacterium]